MSNSIQALKHLNKPHYPITAHQFNLQYSESILNELKSHNLAAINPRGHVVLTDLGEIKAPTVDINQH